MIFFCYFGIFRVNLLEAKDIFFNFASDKEIWYEPVIIEVGGNEEENPSWGDIKGGDWEVD